LDKETSTLVGVAVGEEEGEGTRERAPTDRLCTRGTSSRGKAVVGAVAAAEAGAEAAVGVEAAAAEADALEQPLQAVLWAAAALGATNRKREGRGREEEIG
jgi:hypothetical protein